MAVKTVVAIYDGVLKPLASGDTLRDSGGNAIGGASAPTYTQLDCSTNPNYPAATQNDHIIISVAGKIGGASGITVEVGDVVICTTTNAGGTQAAVGSSFAIINQNIVDTAAAIRKKYTYTIDFWIDGQNQLTGSVLMDISTPIAGYLVAASVKMKSARTAGSIAIEPHKNGTGLTPTGLDLLIDNTDTTKDSATVAYGTTGYDVAAGDTIGFMATSTTYTPLANVGTLTLVLEG